MSRFALMMIAVFVGGGLGSLLRELVTPLLPVPAPWEATLFTNVAACFLIGVLYAARE